MRITYDDKSDLLYIRFDEGMQELVNRSVSDSVTLDLGADERIVGIEILAASKHVDLRQLLPVRFDKVA